jgi:3'-phosphoadenosine 5'-phosphosulfate sulfotransferase (PAPS reductase)/FAD synthetase
MNYQWKLDKGREYIEQAIEQYNPSHCFALFSGGNDSLTATHFATSVLGDRLDGVVHVNTGIGIPQTRQFVRAACQWFGWPLLEYKAVENTRGDGSPDPIHYEDLVMRWGFPGPPGHGVMYNRLKERQIRRLIRDHKISNRKILLVSGCREQESTRRMGTVTPIDPDGRRIWVAPFTHMDAVEVRDYMDQHELPRNPVKQYLEMSGECLCGAFAHEGELEEIRTWYPETAARIEAIQERVVNEAGFPWGWEERAPEWWDKEQARRKVGQADAFEEELENEIGKATQHLCTACHKRSEDLA